MRTLTPREKLERLRAHLRASPDAQRRELAATLDACGDKWNGRYACRLPACPRCRRTNIKRQQETVREFYSVAPNEELALLSVVLPGTRDVGDITTIMKQGHEAARKRLAACRKGSAAWNDVCLTGWFEIDAVGADQFPVLPPNRQALLSSLAPMSFDQTGPTWVPTFHAICYVGPVGASGVTEGFQQQWKLPGQFHLRPFDLTRPVDVNLDAVTSYANKFRCEVTLRDMIVEPWPVRWEADFFSWLHSGPRNAFEFLRFTVGQKSEPKVIQVPTSAEVEPMPFIHSFSRLPMSHYTGLA